MPLLQTIKAAQLTARKNKDAATASLLTTLIGEASMVGKNNGNRESTDAEVIATIKKFINNAQETLKIIETQTDERLRTENKWKTSHEIGVLSSFLPKQFSVEELEAVIVEIIDSLQASSIKDMGKVMKALKERHEGLYDGNAASVLVKTRLS